MRRRVMTLFLTMLLIAVPSHADSQTSDQSPHTAFAIELLLGKSLPGFSYESCGFDDAVSPAHLVATSLDDDRSFEFELPEAQQGTGTLWGADHPFYIFRFEISLPESSVYQFSLLNQELKTIGWLVLSDMDPVQLSILPEREEVERPTLPPETTPDISVDRNKDIVNPVAYTPKATEVHQAGYLNTSGISSQPLAFAFSTYKFSDDQEASRAVQGVCDDMFDHADALTSEASWLATPSSEDKSCVIAPGNPSSVIAAAQYGSFIFAFNVSGVTGDAVGWLNEMLEELNKLDEVQVGDPNWLPSGSWIVQTGPYNITNTARTPIDERPAD